MSMLRCLHVYFQKKEVLSTIVFVELYCRISRWKYYFVSRFEHNEWPKKENRRKTTAALKYGEWSECYCKTKRS